jgi:hypothetical protein
MLSSKIQLKELDSCSWWRTATDGGAGSLALSMASARTAGCFRTQQKNCNTSNELQTRFFFNCPKTQVL